MRVGILPILMQLPMGLGGGMVDEAVTILAIFNYSCPLFWRSTMSTSGSGVGVMGPLLELAQNGTDREKERLHNCSSYELGCAIAFYFNIIKSHPKRL
ncbi:hypothetical protein SESBI_14589 [Sesbania bispinosa]|nr:hypothetical protein SESBI_14589 [Sesbania bispinosa]